MIRHYRDQDAPEILGCIAELQEFERRIDYRLRPGEAIAAAYLEQMLARCRACAGLILVAESGETVVGFATILTRVPFDALDDPPGEYALVSDLVVREPWRRCGYGTTLLRAAEDHAREAGAAELRVQVLSQNAGARALYRRAEFTDYLVTLSKRFAPPAT